MDNIAIAKFAKILRVTGVKTGVGVLIFDVNRSRIGVEFCNFGAGLESESQKTDSGHLWLGQEKLSFLVFIGYYSATRYHRVHEANKRSKKQTVLGYFFALHRFSEEK